MPTTHSFDSGVAGVPDLTIDIALSENMKTMIIPGNQLTYRNPVVNTIGISELEISSKNPKLPLATGELAPTSVARDTGSIENIIDEPPSGITLLPTTAFLPSTQVSQGINDLPVPIPAPRSPITIDQSTNHEIIPDKDVALKKWIPKDFLQSDCVSNAEILPIHSQEVEKLPPAISSEHIKHTACHCCDCGRTFVCFKGDTIPAGVEPGSTWCPSDVDEPESTGIRYGYLKRVFQPADRTEWRGTYNPEILTQYNSTLQTSNYLVSRTENGILYPRLTTMVVAVDGACRRNGTPWAQASVGVFFGPRSRYNCYSRLPSDTFHQTSTEAEAASSLMALRKIEAEVLAHNSSPRTQQVVIITDSEYVVKAMSEHVWGWLETGFVTRKRGNVKSAGLLLALHRTIERLEENLGVDVRFWRVDRLYNKDADGLANEALDDTQQLPEFYMDICDLCPLIIPVPKTCPHV